MNNIIIKSANDKNTTREIKKTFKSIFNTLINDKLKTLRKLFDFEESYIIYDENNIYFINSKISTMNNDNVEYLVIDLYSNKQENNNITNKTMSFLLYSSFIKHNFKKVSIKISSDSFQLKDYGFKYRFTIEGNIQSAYNILDIKSDEIILSLTVSQFNNFSIGYYKIANQYLKIIGSNYGIYSINVCKDDEVVKKKFIEQNNSFYYDRTYSKVKIAIKEIDEYFKGKRTNFDLYLEIYELSDFQREVWDIAKNIPFGEIYSYEEVAANLSTVNREDLKKYSRAVGTALSKNPILIMIPCHRVIGKDGKLKGFAAGVDFKDYLLNHEMLKI